MTTKKSHIITILLWCALSALLIASFLQAATISRFPTISLRYNTPITGQAAHSARQYAINNIDSTPFWPTFWRQSTTELSTGHRTAEVPVISFSGDAALVWHAHYITGSAPSAVDNTGLAVSAALAHSLWGSTDIVGMTVYVDGAPRTVRGVFEGTANLALISFHIEDRTQSWTAVELTGDTPHPARSDANSFAMAAGLGRPDYVLMGGAIAFARILAALPLVILAIYTLALVIGFVKKHYRLAAAPLFFAGLILFAILLPFLLNILPDWAIPTHWSDFSFWASLFRQAGDSLREFLGAPPTLRDVELKMHLLKQAGIAGLSLCVGIVLCTVWHHQR